MPQLQGAKHAAVVTTANASQRSRCLPVPTRQTGGILASPQGGLGCEIMLYYFDGMEQES